MSINGRAFHRRALLSLYIIMSWIKEHFKPILHLCGEQYKWKMLKLSVGLFIDLTKNMSESNLKGYTIMEVWEV